MEIVGAAIGMVVGLAILAIALWEFPKIREDFACAPGFSIAVAAVLGGWGGYWIFAVLFPG